MITFQRVAMLGALICALLFITFAFIPVIPFTMLGVAMTPEGLLMARRMAALFLGIGLVLFLLRNEPDGQTRRSVSLALSLSMAALAVFGLLDFLAGRNGPGVFIALVAEVFYAVTLGLYARGRTS